MEIITQDQVCYQAFIAIEDDKYLEIDTPISLEYLSVEDDGIFETEAKWIKFLNGTFGTGAGSIYLSGELKPATVKKWCYPLEKYKDRFVVKIGTNKFVRVNPDDLQFSFTYDCNLYSRKIKLPNNMPTACEFFVTATIK